MRKRGRPQRSGENQQKKKRLELDLRKKVELIRESAGKSQRELADKYGIGLGTVNRIVTKKESLLMEYEQNTNGRLQRVQRKGPYEDVNVAMWQWFEAARARNIPVSGPLLQEKALEFAAEMGHQNFKASNGWLEAFRKRHTIVFRTMSGESNDAPMQDIEEFRQRLPEITAAFKPEDVFNCDESGLFYRALPEKTLTLKGKACKGGKASKDRLTALFCCNATGTEKETVMVIGRSQKPRCFQRIPLERLPVRWESNNKAWMNTVIFSKWLQFFDRKMRAQERKVLLFLDNASCHPKEIHLTNVTLCYFPPNTTSHLQPLDQGIIKATKVLYRKSLVRHVLARMETCNKATDVSRSVNVFDAVQWLSSAWDLIQSSTIQKCFKKAGFSFSDDEEPDAEEIENGEISAHEAELVDLLIQDGIPEDKAQQYAMLDDSLCTDATEDTEWESSILEEVKARNDSIEDDYSTDASSGNEDNDSGVSAKETLLSYKEAVMFLDRLKKFSIYCEPQIFPAVSALAEKIEDLAVANRLSWLRQQKIEQFFPVCS
jgi:transcriptional regulator with XRE-family HTH domain